ncbi:MAG: hypothetical protein GPJ54_19260 [Candidatus Heimdallarchaeota archaeon]|nr:hypothetical protein [Candidatus Heimdallarchaeota archaeon]
MPFYPTNSQRMIFVVELKFTDDLEFDSNVKPIGFKLVNENDDAWEGKFEEINRPNCGLNCLEKYASGGPNWNGGIEVIPSIILDYNGNQYVIRGPPATVLITV